MKEISCVFVGANRVGKTNVIKAFMNDGYHESYHPTTLDTFNVTGTVGKSQIGYKILDCGIQNPANIDKAINQVDIVVLCYSVSKPFSFEILETRYQKLVKKYAKSKVFILAGLQSDTRFTKTAGLEFKTLQEYNSERRRSVISRVQGEKLADKLKLKLFLECSAVTKKNVDTLFQKMFALSVTEMKKKTPRKSPRRKSSIKLNLKPFTMRIK